MPTYVSICAHSKFIPWDVNWNIQWNVYICTYAHIYILYMGTNTYEHAYITYKRRISGAEDPPILPLETFRREAGLGLREQLFTQLRV